ncbi:tyrosine protein kinase [Lactococcus hodotermopsidis]|uniref:Tyrosine-protein kinase CpsD n=1 Tax=Pseudolactococcus hodotermopsidis TaxID=2709157 RepID=A0A6A0BB21_9LACT|nr:CpsD/CapB family tyrosine-protein kinase [Lactococcus hodotermopsidis]GFH41875.1 tyrosine protein kinase [Lactococcus hodotermopsidis]
MKHAKNFQQSSRNHLVALSEHDSIAAEQYRTIRSNIRFSFVDSPLQSLVVTSAGPSEGKSTTAANLAIVFANAGKRVLLVDGDLRRPTVAMTFDLPNVIGLSSLLIDQSRSYDDLIYKMSIDNLWILPSGPKPPNPSELLASNRMETIINELSDVFDLVIFDMPPVVNVSDAQIVAARVDGTIFVVRERKTPKKQALKAQELLKLAKANIVGVVYNGVSKNDKFDYYYY